MTDETRSALKDILGIHAASEVTPHMVQRLQSAARELLTEPAAVFNPPAKPAKEAK